MSRTDPAGRENDNGHGPASVGTDADRPRCELCGRVGVRLTRHHLIPRARLGKSRTARLHGRDRRDLVERVAMLCSPCHKTVHMTLSEKELAEHFHTLPRLREHGDIARFIAFVRKQPAEARVKVRRRSDRN